MFPRIYETFELTLTPSIRLCCDPYSTCTSSCKQAAWAHRRHKIATRLYSITCNTPSYVPFQHPTFISSKNQHTTFSTVQSLTHYL